MGRRSCSCCWRYRSKLILLLVTACCLLFVLRYSLQRQRCNVSSNYLQNFIYKCLGVLFPLFNASFCLPYCDQEELKLEGYRHSNSDIERLPILGGSRDTDNVFSNVMLGGSWQPVSCISRQTIAIVVPFRDRRQHLHSFMKYIHPFLQRQLLAYTIFVIEQAPGLSFNRGILLNIGFVEAMKIRQFDCFVFHDVDLIPENDWNVYACADQPAHLSSAVDTMAYRVPYDGIFGGVVALRASHFQLINGFSNKFFGWGGEDDDIYNRIKYRGLNITRTSAVVGRYRMLPHRKEYPNSARHSYLSKGSERFKTDGLNSLRYTVLKLLQQKLYTHVIVNFDSV